MRINPQGPWGQIFFKKHFFLDGGPPKHISSLTHEFFYYFPLVEKKKSQITFDSNIINFLAWLFNFILQEKLINGLEGFNFFFHPKIF